MRRFETGATRDDADNKLDYEGFLSPLVLKRYAEYMHECRKQADDELRDSDNWQRGIPQDVYMKSMWRHFMSVWTLFRGEYNEDTLNTLECTEELCALLFNVMGMMHEQLINK